MVNFWVVPSWGYTFILEASYKFKLSWRLGLYFSCEEKLNIKFRDDNLWQTKAVFGYKYKMNDDDDEDDDNTKVIIPKYKHSL